MTNGEEKRKGPDLVTVLAAVATAIGTLGWVAFIGGAILWISFNQANLPTAEAVARVPTGVLVATGAEFVVWAVLAALMRWWPSTSSTNRSSASSPHRMRAEGGPES